MGKLFLLSSIKSTLLPEKLSISVLVKAQLLPSEQISIYCGHLGYYKQAKNTNENAFYFIQQRFPQFVASWGKEKVKAVCKGIILFLEDSNDVDYFLEREPIYRCKNCQTRMEKDQVRNHLYYCPNCNWEISG